MSEVSDAIVIVVSEETGHRVGGGGRQDGAGLRLRPAHPVPQSALVGDGENDKTVGQTVVNRLLGKDKKPRRKKKKQKQEEKNG